MLKAISTTSLGCWEQEERPNQKVDIVLRSSVLRNLKYWKLRYEMRIDVIPEVLAYGVLISLVFVAFTVITLECYVVHVLFALLLKSTRMVQVASLLPSVTRPE